LEDAEKYGAAFGVDPRWLKYGEGEPPSNRRKTALTTPPNATVRRETVSVSSSKRLPVLGKAIGGLDGRFLFNGEAIEYVMCPPALENVPGAYAVYVIGDSMENRYFSGEIVFVHPNKPFRKGHFVVVQIINKEDETPLGYVKQFIAQTPTRLILRQLNPDTEIEFPLSDVVSVHRIVLGGEP
jgi:phage repressor protein C with HTH and peptisase S24 domain